MASAAGTGEEEQSQKVAAEIVPAAAETGDLGHHMAPASFQVKITGPRIRDMHRVLEGVQTLLPMISEVLGAGAPRRRLKDDIQRRWLALVEKELRHTAKLVSRLIPTELHHSNHAADYPRLLMSLNSLQKFRWLVSDEFLRGGNYDTSAQIAEVISKLIHLVELYECRCLVEDIWDRESLNLKLLQQPQGPQPVDAGGVPLIGVDRLIAKLLRWLTPRETTNNRRRPRVMSVVGPAGVGKTALVMELCNRLLSCQNSPRFHCIIMAQIPRGIDRHKPLLRDILSQIQSSDDSQPQTIGLLERCVSEQLQDKRYLIVIDGIREACDWERIKDTFPSNNLDSVILITTRLNGAAKSPHALCCSGSDGLVHEMKPLSHIDSEMLLLARAFGIADGGPPDNARLISDEILVRSEGIPLFITVMADWLKAKLQQQHNYMEEVTPQIEKFGEALYTNTCDDFTYPMMLLFLYMGIFPLGYRFEMDHLLMKWAVERMPQCSWSSITEEMAREMPFFWHLVGANVIVRAASNYEHSLDEGTNQWRVNQFMLPFLAMKCKEIGFITDATLNSVACHNNETTILRRLSLHHPVTNLPSLLQRMDLSQTRSLTVSGTVSGIHINEFVNLITLDLDGWKGLDDEQLAHVCKSKMFFLLYLSVRNTQVSKLPREINELQNLILLDVSYTKVSGIPCEIKELHKLRVLNVSYTKVSKLPFEMLELTLLNQLDLRGNRVKQPASFIQALGALRELRMLAITWSFHQCIDEAFREALRSSMQRWRKLESITIHCGLGCSMEFLGSRLSNPPTSLEKFKVTAGSFASIPKWFNNLYRLTFVEITIASLGTEDLTILRELPKLQCLILGLDFIPREAIVVNKWEFWALQRLSIECPVPWLTFGEGAMLQLTHLQLKFCAWPAMQTSVPSGINHLLSLTNVALCYDARYINAPNVRMTVEAVRREVVKNCNPINFFINGVEEAAAQAMGEVAEDVPCIAKVGQDHQACMEASEDTEGLSKAVGNVEQELAVQQGNHQEEEEDSMSREILARSSIDSASSSLNQKTERKGKDTVSSDPLLEMLNEFQGDIKGMAKNIGKMVEAMEREATIHEKAIAELRKLAFTGAEQIKAAAMFGKMPQQMSLFLTLDETLRREFILTMLSEEEKSKRIEDGTR